MKSPQSNILGFVLLFGFIGLLSYVVFSQSDKTIEKITSFDECAAAGYPIMESYPEQCRTPDGKVFVAEVKAPIEELKTATSSSTPQ